MHITRTLSKSILETSKSFKILLLTGPRQVGKTTLLQNLQSQNRSYISLDDVDIRLSAKEDPAGFVDQLKLPILIDEVQYAPEIFPYLKMAVDKSSKNGTFWLTGSQQFSMMKNVSESLAGRVGILELQGISLAEDQGRADTPPFIPIPSILKKRRDTGTLLSLRDLYFKIWRGSYPHLVLTKGKSWERFYQSYVTTYIERDVRDYLRIDDLALFRKFLQIAAARTGQMINYREISNEVGVSEPTIKSWFNVLQATGLVTFLQPYFKNTTKRILKTPKFYFMDTGLACFLTRWTDPVVLEKGAMSGAILETYVISEIIKSFLHNGQSPPVYYYADKDRREVDILIEHAGVIHPIEIKKSASIRNTSFRGFDNLNALKTPVGHGCVLMMTKDVVPFSKNIDLVPIGFI